MKNRYPLIIFSLIILTTLSACQTIAPADTSNAQELKQHPLIDKIWSVSTQKFISADMLKSKVLESEVILLGETHDNTRHHQLQAQFIAHLSAHDHSPVIAYEMLNQKQQEKIDQFLKKVYSSSNANNPDKISKQVEQFSKLIDWENSGWPEWQLYRPVFYNAIESQLPIIAANLNIKTIRKVIKEGSKVLDTTYQELLIKYQYNDALKKELEKEILSSHCDMLPEKMLAPMLMGQQVRDLAMTQAILNAFSERENVQKVVLIAGSGHTRNDHAIPYYLHQERPESNILSLSFMEVSEDEFIPADYAQAWSDTATQLPFDYVWFTEKSEREDQCEKMKAYMKKKKSN